MAQEISHIGVHVAAFLLLSNRTRTTSGDARHQVSIFEKGKVNDYHQQEPAASYLGKDTHDPTTIWLVAILVIYERLSVYSLFVPYCGDCQCFIR